GWDEFFGYGRLDAYKSVDAAAEGWIPPEADITSPEWFQQISPQEPAIAVEGHVGARSGYTCRVEVAPGAQPNNLTIAAGGDFAEAEAGFCDGTTVHTGGFSGKLATLSTDKLAALFPKTNPDGFEGNENGGGANVQSSNGRPNTQPYAFTVRL